MNVDNTGMFAGEQPEPIAFGNPGKVGQKKKNQKECEKKRKRSASGKRQTSPYKNRMTYDQKQTSNYKKSIDQLNKKIGAKDKPKPLDNSGWNDNTHTGKYFDVNVDARERRAV